MSKRKYPAEVYARVASENPHASNYAIGKLLGVDEATVRRNLDRVDYRRYLIPVDESYDRFFFDVDEAIEVKEDSVMITADWHIPLYDPEYANKMITHARENDIRTLIVGGDFFNFDSISRFDDKQEDAGLEREIDEGIAVMDVLCQTFDRIIYVWGNHDARIHRRLGYKMAFKSTMQTIFRALDTEDFAKIEFSNLDHAWVEQNGERWYVCHPDSYTRVPLSGARVLATKVQTNVITAHSHHCAVGYAIDGEHVVCEIGGLFDTSKTRYLQRTTTHPTWTQGFAWLKNGKLGVSSPGWSLI
jgi:predicted phosphodiesterase